MILKSFTTTHPQTIRFSDFGYTAFALIVFSMLLTGTAFAADEEYAINALYDNNLQKNILLLEDRQQPYSLPLFNQSTLSGLLVNGIKTRQPEYSVIHKTLDSAINSDDQGMVFQLLQKYNPEIVIIRIGVNDGMNSFPVKQISRNLAALIMRAKKQNADVILLSSTLPYYHGQNYILEYSQMFRQLANKHHITYIADNSTTTFPGLLLPPPEHNNLMIDQVLEQVSVLLAKHIEATEVIHVAKKEPLLNK